MVEWTWLMGNLVKYKSPAQIMSLFTGITDTDGVEKSNLMIELFTDFYKLFVGDNDDEKEEMNEFVDKLIKMINREIVRVNKIVDGYQEPDDGEYELMISDVNDIFKHTKIKMVKIFKGNHRELKKMDAKKKEKAQIVLKESIETSSRIISDLYEDINRRYLKSLHNKMDHFDDKMDKMIKMLECSHQNNKCRGNIFCENIENRNHGQNDYHNHNHNNHRSSPQKMTSNICIGCDNNVSDNDQKMDEPNTVKSTMKPSNSRRKTEEIIEYERDALMDTSEKEKSYKDVAIDAGKTIFELGKNTIVSLRSISRTITSTRSEQQGMTNEPQQNSISPSFNHCVLYIPS